MKIISREMFLKLPIGTLYSKYRPGVNEGLKIKGEDYICHADDWYYQDLIGNVNSSGSNETFDILFKSEKDHSSFLLDFDTEGRDGFFNEKQLFAVYEKEDVTQLVERLIKALNRGYKKN